VASHTISGQKWPNGTSVSVYNGTGWIPGYQPSGNVVASGTVSSGSVTFTGLAEDTRYVAWALSAGVTFLIGSQRTTGDRSRLEKIETEGVAAAQQGSVVLVWNGTAYPEPPADYEHLAYFGPASEEPPTDVDDGSSWWRSVG
jgi:hypothetical protein